MRNRRLFAFSVLLGVALAIPGVFAGLVAEQTRWEAPELDLSRVTAPEVTAAPRRLGEHLWDVGGLKVVVVRGTPREMGRQYGAAVAGEIRHGRDSYLYKHVRDSQGYSMDYMTRCAHDMARHIPDEYLEEMKGVAEGSGVPYEEILIMHTHADMVHYGHDWGQSREQTHGARPHAGTMACSNFVVWGAATADGKMYHGRNLDWTTGTAVQDSAVVYIGIPQQGYPFALVTYAGLVGAVTGMNDQGLTFGEMTSMTGDKTLDGEPLMIICRRLLQYCSTLSEAERMVKAYRCTTGWNFMVGSGREGDARAFEVDASEAVVFRPDDPEENHPPVSQGFPCALYRTNHPCSPRLQQKAAANLGIASLELAKLAVRGMDTWQRYESLRLWITGKWHGKVDARIARAMLQTSPVAAKNTLHSVVFAPTDLRMWVANATSGSDRAPAWKCPYHMIDLHSFLN